MKISLKAAILAAVIAMINGSVMVVAVWVGAKLWVIFALAVGLALVSAFVFGLLADRMIAAPLKRLNDAVNSSSYKKDHRTMNRDDEIGRLCKRIYGINDGIAKEKAKQSRIIASISHDIKTPLTSVMGYTEFLKNPKLSPERRQKYLNTIYSKAEEIRDIVVEFDDYLSGNLNQNLNRDFISVLGLINEAADRAKTAFPDGGCELVLSVSELDGLTLYADSAKLHRVFLNLISNSVKHSMQKKPVVVISAEVKGSNIAITVSDNGRGVKPEELLQVFEPMYTSDRSRSVAGLGLAICKEIVLSHGGQITADSRYGEYFAVTVTLPLASVNE